ncbi:MAG TPA: hypothetical protein VE860_01555 [Chthoniobacterales bacterium]|jgi:predicted nucleic acid-binding protein|nr:hypothetical protein [Chthoniobacterales bacterium]
MLVSILDQSIVKQVRIHGPKQVTDVYLLALAVKHAARFITFDAAVPISAVVAAKKVHFAAI